MLTAIPCTLMRGGTSKGLYFHADDLPAELCRGGERMVDPGGWGSGRHLPGLERGSDERQLEGDDNGRPLLFAHQRPREVRR